MLQQITDRRTLYVLGGGLMATLVISILLLPSKNSTGSVKPGRPSRSSKHSINDEKLNQTTVASSKPENDGRDATATEFSLFPEAKPLPAPIAGDNTSRVLRDGAGRLLAQSEFKDGRPDGDFSLFHQNGWGAVQMPQKGGKPHGKWVAWHKNGIVAIEGEFTNGLRHGTWMFWDTNGLKKRQEVYDSGTPAGRWVNWDAKGKVWRVRSFGA